jgi:hypothetical protein
MPDRGATLSLQPNEFAFYFSTNRGIEANELGDFLKRAATVAKRAGTEIRVIGIEHGSLAVKLTALTKAIKKDFMKQPVGPLLTMGGGAVAATVAAISWAMQPQGDKVDPLAKSGASVVEKHEVSKIEIITVNQTIVVMDEERAADIREVERRARHRETPRLKYDIPAMVADMRDHHLEGSTVEIRGVLHFQPDGTNFYVPVDLSKGDMHRLQADAYYQVQGELRLKNGQPDSMIIFHARQL